MKIARHYIEPACTFGDPKNFGNLFVWSFLKNCEQRLDWGRELEHREVLDLAVTSASRRHGSAAPFGEK
jgi:hypothetical protein